jgi:hypothetical protein
VVEQTMDVAGWLRKQLEEASPDLLRAMVKEMAEALMGAEAGALCGAGYGERSPEWVNGATATASATGTRVGSIELPVPKLREGSYFPNRQTRSSRATAASHRSKRARAALSDTGSTVAATGSSTPRSTGSRSRRRATTRAHAPTSSANAAKARANEKHSAASNDSSSASSSRPKSEPCLDIGATLAHPTDDSHPIERRTAHA